MAQQKKLPAMQFYTGDWMKDANLRSVSLSAKGLWMDVLCLMFESDRRGYLQCNGKPFTHEQIARMTGCSSEEASQCLEELESSGVFSRTKNGIIFSRRMARDEEKRRNAVEYGKLGGNPSLKGRVNPMDNPKPRSSVSSSSSVSHTHKPTVRVEKISDFESVFSASYEAVLSVYREVTGKKGADRNTKEGARTLAQAMDAGELAESQVRDIIRNGSKDEKLPNQSLRGIANNYEKYLSGKKDDAPAVFYECAKCGLIHKDRWVAGMQTASGTESPIKCRCGGARRIP